MSALELTRESRATLDTLAALRQGALREATARAVERARANLDGSTEAFSWSVIDEAEALLPPPGRSAFVFVIRGAARPEPHRHPNSVQHLRSLAGAGHVVLSRLGGPDRSEHVLDAGQPWLVVAADVRHSVRSVTEREWGRRLFHTVRAAALVEVTESGARHYD